MLRDSPLSLPGAPAAGWEATTFFNDRDGLLASYLRYHAYAYVKWFFGTDFG